MENHKRIIAAGLLIFLLLVSAASAATLNVGSKAKYHTIQSAVDAAHDGDIIKVAPGIYRETVKINKWNLSILGTKYPRVNGFGYYGGSGTINGFKIMKDGVYSSYAGSGLIRNNYFYNCWVSLSGSMASPSTIMNNKFYNGGIDFYDTYDDTKITGNTIDNKGSVGLLLYDIAGIPQVTKNTFKNCDYAVYFQGDGWDQNPGRLPTFSGNKYIKNKVNIGWGTNYM